MENKRTEIDFLNLIYRASHDLKGPLRTIKSFSQILNKSFADRIKEDEKELFSFIFDATDNLEDLIIQLVTFGKTCQTPLLIGDVDFGNLLELLKINTLKQSKYSNAVLNLKHNNEIIRADREKLNHLLDNLISNSLKFQKKDNIQEIDVSIEEAEDTWVISVKDNGIGIAAENHLIIFDLFEKLHANSVYRGSGIGLALCKRIAEDHNGEISVESETEKGSIFKFHFPKNL